MAKRVKVGIDLGGTRIKMALVDAGGKILCGHETDTPSSAKSSCLINCLVDNIAYILDMFPIKKSQLAGVGIGVPGPVDSKKGIVRYFPNIKGWDNVPLKSILQRRLGLKVTLDNDVNAMTLAEYRFGAGRGAANIVCITLGTGVGGGVIIDGKLYRGSTMCAGEIGHIPINEKGPKCNCGGIACLERYVGNRYILERAGKIFGKGITLEHLSALAKKGNKKAVVIWQDVGKKIGVALTGVVNVLDPDRIIVGGGVSNAGEFILGPMRKEIKLRAMKDQAAHVKVIRA
ncbi:MAG: ROK family protein, partial [Candidatus Omnitrophica bacterium]|nr:ROK family protein [Candidatus Omnitrophota bacterium]